MHKLSWKSDITISNKPNLTKQIPYQPTAYYLPLTYNLQVQTLPNLQPTDVAAHV